MFIQYTKDRSISKNLSKLKTSLSFSLRSKPRFTRVSIDLHEHYDIVHTRWPLCWPRKTTQIMQKEQDAWNTCRCHLDTVHSSVKSFMNWPTTTDSLAKDTNHHRLDKKRRQTHELRVKSTSYGLNWWTWFYLKTIEILSMYIKTRLICVYEWSTSFTSRFH